MVTQREQVRYRNRIPSVLPGLLLPGILFIVFPLKLYLPNRDEFGADVLLGFAGLALIGMLLVLGMVWIESNERRDRIARGLFFGGLYLLLADMLAPPALGVLDGQKAWQTIPEPVSFTLIEGILLVGVVVAAFRLPTRWVRVAGAICLLAFPGWELANLVLVRLSDEAVAEAPATESGSDDAKRPNIYHLFFDAFSGDGFERILADLDMRDRFDGFVYFPRNRSNHSITLFSVPSFLTSELIEEDGFSSWRMAALSGRSGLLSDVRRSGYATWGYGQHGHCRFGPEHCSSGVGVEQPWVRNARIAFFSDLWLLRVVPNFLQSEVHAGGQGAFSRALAWADEERTRYYLWARMILALFDQLIQDTEGIPANNQYIYAHLLLPHVPFVLERDCSYLGSEHSYRSDEETPSRYYFSQATCVASRIVIFLDRLRELGRYDDSVIVIHADHGSRTRCVDPTQRPVSEQLSREMQDVSLNGLSGSQLECLSRGLLLVKPAGTRPGEGLIVSDRPTQLLDLRATIRALMGLPPIASAGSDVLAEQFPTEREFDFMAGGYRPIEQASALGRTKLGTLCVQNDEGDLNHFSHSPRSGWRIHPNVFVRCDD